MQEIENQIQTFKKKRKVKNEKNEKKSTDEPNEISSIIDITIDGNPISLEEFKNKLDFNKDKKIDIEDLKIWFKIILNALIYGLILAVWFNRNQISAAITSGQFFSDGIISGLSVSALKFAWNGGKQKMNSQTVASKQELEEQINNDVNKIDTLESKLEEATKRINNYDTVIQDVVTTYENEIFKRDLQINGYEISTQAKDDITRGIIKKHDILKGILKQARILGLISNDLDSEKEIKKKVTDIADETIKEVYND